MSISAIAPWTSPASSLIQKYNGNLIYSLTPNRMEYNREGLVLLLKMLKLGVVSSSGGNAQ